MVNTGLIRTANIPQSNIDDFIVIEDDDVVDTADGVNKVQECKMDKPNSNPTCPVSGLS